MNYVFKILLLSALLLMVFGCNKRLDNYELDYSGNRLVLFGNISNELGVTVYLTHTLPPTGTYYFDEINVEVSDATIVLFENNIAVDTLTEIEPGSYFLSYVPFPGNSYSVTASATRFVTVFSDNVLFHDSISLDDVVYEAGFEDISGDPAFSVLPVFNDDISIKNYYAFGFRLFIGEDLYTGNVYENPDSDPLGCEAGIFVYNEAFIKVYSDNCFSGIAFPFTFISAKVYHEAEIFPFDKCEFTISAISNELYNYISNQSETAGTQLLFSDPKINYTNINNGFGVFWAQNDTTFVYHF